VIPTSAMVGTPSKGSTGPETHISAGQSTGKGQSLRVWTLAECIAPTLQQPMSQQGSSPT
jgi:hypothetical protein